MSKKDAIEDVYPLTPLQEGLLFHSVYAPHGGQYHDQFSAVLRGPLRPELLGEAWAAVVAATPILRTAFAWQSGGAPLQVVARRVDAPLRLEDWRPLTGVAAAERRARLLAEDVAVGFDLGRAPLTRVTLARLDDATWFLLWSRHHLLLDGWSVTLVLRAWLAGYADRCAGRPPALPSVRPFHAYVDWLRRQDEALAREFWTAELGDLVEPAGLGLARPPGGEAPAGEDRHAEINHALGPEETAALVRLARAAGVTLAAVFQGAWALLLARLGGERDVVFGLTVAGRPADLPGVDEMVGLFINTIPLRLRIQPDQSLGAWLRAGQARAAAAREFEHAPLVKIHGWSGVARDRALFETLLVVENYPVEAALAGRLGTVAVEEARSHERTHYPATLIVAPGERIGLRLLHDRARVTDAQAARWLDGLRTVLAGMAAGEARSVGSLGALGGAERDRVLIAWNRTARVRDRAATLPALVAAQVKRTPQAVAVVDEHRRLSYAELQARADRLSTALRRAGAGPERCVGVCVGRSVDLVVALLGVLGSGAAYVPLDPAYPAERLAFMAGDAGLVALVAEPGLEARVPIAGIPILRVDAGPDADGAWPLPLPGNLAYLIYTSGSTGRPKAAAIEHRQAAALVDWASSVFSARELSGVLFSTSVCFDLSVFEVFVTLATGGKVIVAENALALPTHPARGEVTLLNTVPSAAAELARQEAIPSGVVCVCLAGEPLTAALADRLYAFPSVERVCDLYGPSEDTTYSTFAQRQRGGPATVGRVIDHSRLYLLDDDLQPAPIGAVGEIHLAGDGLARGYLGRPDLTADRFGPDPFAPEPGGRLYRTGDLARFREDGQLEFLGRRDHQVKIRGFRIELGEVQARLEAHPEVAEAAVIARVHPERGAYLAAFVAPKPAAAPSIDRLAAWMRETLPVYMMPAAWRILPRLPRTPNGKLDRRLLPGDEAGLGPPAAQAAPRPADPAHEIVAGIWAQVLGVGAVHPNDNFFELGGHSLLATQAVSRVRVALRTEVELRALFDHPTLSAFVAALRARRLGDPDPVEAPVERRPAGSAPPQSLAQARMWTLARLAPDSPAYHVPAVLEATGPLDAEALRRALETVVARHEALCMTYPEEDGLARVAVGEAAPLAVAVDDLRDVPPAERPAAARRIATEEGWRPFDLARGPLVRARLIRLEPNRHWLLLTCHHIATDAWSEWILVREVGAAYAGQDLGPDPLGYGDYACWQRQQAGRDAAARQVSWWKEELAGLPVLDLPPDGPLPAVPSQRGAAVEATVDEAAAEALRVLGRAQGATLFVVLLAAWEACLYRSSGQADFGVGVPVAGRTRPELENVIGLFVNTLVIRSDVGEALTFGDLVKRVRERTLRAFDRQEAPFERVVEAVQPDRRLGRTPLFQVMFSMQNAPRASLDLGGVTIEPLDVETHGAKFELTLAATEGRDGRIRLSLVYSRDRFGPARAARFLGGYREFLQSAAGAGGGAPLRELLGEFDPGIARRAAAPPAAPVASVAAPVPAGFVAPLGRVESLLAGWWSDLLRVERVGRHDNFFALGGDSIRALQVSARAAAAGIRVPAQAVFERQTLAELAGVAQEAEAHPCGACLTEGEELPLSPIQAWFFEQPFPQRAHWNQSALYATPADFDADRFESALRRAAGRHEALHLRYDRSDGRWRARRGAPGASVAFTRAAAADWPRGAEAVQAGLDPERGPLLRAAWFFTPGRPEGRLLLAAHHLAIDVVSWSVLLEDLAAAYAAPDRRFSPETGWPAWVRALAAEAGRVDSRAELDFWRRVPASRPLPRDFEAPGSGTGRDEAYASSRLTAAETAALRGGPSVQGPAGISPLLLAALARTLRAWTGQSGHTVAVEAHGREGFPGSPPVEGTLGWFTALFPFRLEVPDGADPTATLADVRAAWQAVPRRGIGYGLLRYLGSPEIRAELGAQPGPELCFNYLGQLDAPDPTQGFRLAMEPRGPDHGTGNPRPFLLEINAAVRDGALDCVWSFSRAHHREAAVQGLADRFADELRALAGPAGSAVAAPAPAAYSAEGLSQSDLNTILSRLAR